MSDLTSDAFIASLKRFCSRRGAAQYIYSDNGKTFVGAKRQLSELFKFVTSLNKDGKICYYLSQKHIEWDLIPVSSHFGGLWEAAVRSVKFHIKRVIENLNLTFEELHNLLTQIEATSCG